MEQTADLYLWRWAPYARGGGVQAYSKRCVLDRFNEGGIAVGAVKPPSDMPEDVLLTDRAVAALGLRHRSILRRAIYLRYERGYPDEGVASALRVNLRKARNLLLRARRAMFFNRQLIA